MEAILYAAKSTKDTKGSIPTQLEDGRTLAARRKLRVAAEFQDEDKSAYHDSRGPGLAAAMEECERLAPCALIVQHSDRLARGDAKQARHLIEVVLWALKHDVELLSVQDPEMLSGGDMALLMGAIGGMRNNEDSKRKGSSVKDGLRRTVERGEWRGSAAPEGFRTVKEVRGKDTVRWIEKHPDDREKFELIWRLDLEGRSAMAISLELDRRGWMTRPSRVNVESRRFSVRHVRRILNSPAQAGLQVLRGEVYEAGWEGYVDPETFWRRKAERSARAPKHPGGRPAKDPRLLAGLARCGRCGSPAQAASGTRPRKDGSRRRLYICSAHRYHHKDSPEWCPVPPWDATEVDRYALENVEALLGDAEALRAQMDAGKAAEREKLRRVAEEATADAVKAERAAERATTEFADAEDADERALLKDAAKAKRADAKLARKRADAALDALERGPEVEDDALTRLWETVQQADGDVKMINAALRERFDAFFLKPGAALCAPVFRGEALVAELLGEREVTAELLDALRALDLPA